ncbi:WGR domain-containing protein [Longispora albida]|uniref:WGR domain-containing protein n=1 Tax=Longispora albida TaxID=203523 RepID=UPI00036FEA35|nr:WGR domain-containing protein [Longispora albida]
MSTETTYLELSEDGGGSHKFYEVVVEGGTVTIRYGRIGESGQVKTSSFADLTRARAEAQKKIREKMRKGYEEAVQGVRQRRAVTRRVIQSVVSTASRAPVLWRFRSGASAFGIFVDEHKAMVGNEDGQIYTLALDGQVTRQYRLPDGVKCIVADDDWIYAGCDDGNVYDLSGKAPRVSYEIARDVDIYWLDIHDGVLGVSDAGGGISVFNHEDEFQWRRPGNGTGGWMVRCDDLGVYQGHSNGVTMYDWETGKELWHQSTKGGVLFGWQEAEAVYAGTVRNQVHALSKTGKPLKVYQCDASVYSCATSPDGRYVFAGDNHSSVYCFDADGTRLWKLGTGCGSAFSMQYRDERLYIVTTDGSLACIDASEAAIKAAQAGTVPQTRDIKAPKLDAILPSSTVETVAEAAGGVIVECYAAGSELRMRVVSPGFQQSWRVQFPKQIRTAGARYVVDEVRESVRGGFYRAYGDIRRLS